MLFIWRHLEKFFKNNDESVLFWALHVRNITNCTLSCVTQGNVWSIGSKFLFSFNRKTRLGSFFWFERFLGCTTSEDRRAVETLSCWRSFHVTRHHVGPLCWLRFDPVFYSWAAFCGKQKNGRNNIHDMLQIPQIPLRWPSSRMFTGPVFRWRRYIPPSC